MRNKRLLRSVVCLFVLTFSAPFAQADDQKGAAKKKTKAAVATMVIKGALPESAGAVGLFGELEQNLRDAIDRLDKAAKDKSISAVLLRIRNPAIGRGKLEELRSAIARTRAAGKKVTAQLEMGTASDYLLAAACDQIIMPESGMLVIPGVRAEVTFYKSMLDKLGIKADMLQVGKFKGAAEPMTREGMSPEFRKQFELVIDDYYDQLVDTIATDRKLDRKKVRELIDAGLLTANAAKKAGLIDVVAYDDQLDGNLKKQLAVDEIELKVDYGKKKIDDDFSGMLGMIKLFELMMGAEPGRRTSRNPKIAVVYAVGSITSGKGGAGLFGGQTMGSDTIIKALRKANDDATVKAIVLRVNSPGGSALASDLIWREIERIEKPVFASMGDVAASGGYYISMGCDKIYAEPGTLTGSIGVVGGKMAMTGLYDKIGLKTEVISRGKNSGLFSPTSPFTDSERKVWKAMMEETYGQFTGKAAKGRKMDLKKLESLASGRIWTGRQAKGNGLVDELGTLRDALLAAKKAAGMKATDKAELLILPKPKSFLEEMFSGPSARLGLNVGVEKLAPNVAAHLGEVETLRKLFAEPAVLVLPYRVEIK